MNWAKFEGSGFPGYIGGFLDDSVARSGKYSFRLQLNGGNVLYRYPAGRIAAQVGSTYRVDAWCKTKSLKNARAVVRAYLADVDGNELPDTRQQAKPFISENDEWSELVVTIPVVDEKASSIVVELGLLQADQYSHARAGLTAQDIEGIAWFDDVRIAQVPRTLLSTDRLSNVFGRSEQMALRLNLRDNVLADLTTRLVVFDGSGKSVFQQTGPLHAEHSGGAQSVLAVLPLPDLQTGWYRAVLDLYSEDQNVGSQAIDLVRLPDDIRFLPRDRRLAIVATDVEPKRWRDVVQLLRDLPAGRVKLPIWSEHGSIEKDNADTFRDTLTALRDLGVEITACLVAFPPDLAESMGGSDFVRVGAEPKSVWQPQLAYMLARHANHLRQWQLGEDNQAERFVHDPRLRGAYTAMYREFQQLMGQPQLSMPWPAWYEEGDDGTDVAHQTLLNIPAAVLPEQLSLYVKSRDAGSRLIRLWPIERERYGRAMQLSDMAQRITFALAAGSDRIDLPMPAHFDEAGVFQPDEMFLAYRSLMSRAGASQQVIEMPLDTSARAFCFDRGPGSSAIVWRRNGTDDQSLTLRVMLGQNVTAVDLLGRRVPTRVIDRIGTIEFEVGSLPVLLDNIDPSLASLRASVKVNDSMLESSFQPHHRVLSFKNTFPVGISGSLRITGPAGWGVVTQMNTFSLNPGETIDIPLSIEFPFNSFAGEKLLELNLEVQATQNYRMTIPVALQLGLRDIGLQSIAMQRGDQLVVQQVITNYGQQPLSYNAFVLCPGAARQERLIANLGPGKTTIKRYTFPMPPAGESIRSGMREIDGLRVLNQEVRVGR